MLSEAQADDLVRELALRKGHGRERQADDDEAAYDTATPTRREALPRKNESCAAGPKQTSM